VRFLSAFDELEVTAEFGGKLGRRPTMDGQAAASLRAGRGKGRHDHPAGGRQAGLQGGDVAQPLLRFGEEVEGCPVVLQVELLVLSVGWQHISGLTWPAPSVPVHPDERAGQAKRRRMKENRHG
jgi:hypothetical protein